MAPDTWVATAMAMRCAGTVRSDAVPPETYPRTDGVRRRTVIRKYRPEDCEEVLRVWAAASALAHPFLSESFPARERDEIRNVHLPGGADTWVSEADGRVVGFIALIGNEVGAVFVAPDSQRSGIGWALMDHARALRGELEVEVFVDNSVGGAFYAKYGFLPVLQKVHEHTGLRIMRLRLPR